MLPKETTFIILLTTITVIIYIVANFNQLKEEKWTKKLFILFLVIAASIAYKFIESGGGLSYIVEPELWAHYGSFLGAFLLAATLLFQIRSFRQQQVEAKFYEMIKYYRDNLTEMKFRNPFFYENGNGRKSDEEYVIGRRVIKTIFQQYKTARILVKNELQGHVIRHITTNDFTNEIELEYLKKYKKEIEYVSGLKEKEQTSYLYSNIAYLITFWGTPLDITSELKKYIYESLRPWTFDSDKSEKLKKKITNKIVEATKQLVAIYECEGDISKYSKAIRKEPLGCISAENKIKFFGGHQYHLAHYYRHFFRTVIYIHEQPKWLVSSREKMDYIDLLRAQMSNYEQALLFLNSLSLLGHKWENNGETNLITKYGLIRNLPKSFIPDMNPKKYYGEIKFEWDNIEYDFEESQNTKTKSISHTTCPFCKQKERQ